MTPRLISTTRTSGDRTGYPMFRPDFSRLFYQETFDTENILLSPQDDFCNTTRSKADFD